MGRRSGVRACYDRGPLWGRPRYARGRGSVKRVEEASVNQAEWDRVKTRLKQEFGESAFKSWVIPITATAMRDGEVELSVPTRFMRDWITTHYAERIRALWSGENPSVRKITLKVDATKADGQLVQ